MSGGGGEQKGGGAGIVERADVATLERELRDLWKQMAAKTQDNGEQAVTRACVHNLVIYAPGDRSETELSRMLSDLMVDQPGRVILVLSDEGVERNAMNAWVNAQCHRTSGQRQQVCSEQIVVRAGVDSISSLSSLVIPLLVPELPVFFWWRADLNDDWQYFEEVMENADRVIVDSARFSKPLESLRKLISIVKAEKGNTSFSDLNWGRITPWRQMIAGFFEHTACRNTVNSISSVDIQSYSPSGFSTQAFLLACWLGARLKWNPISGGNNVLLMESGGRQLRQRLFVRPPVAGAARGIASVTLRTEKPPITFHMALDAGTRYLRGSVEMEGARPADTTVRLGAGAEDERLACELEILGRDRIFEETLALLERIL